MATIIIIAVLAIVIYRVLAGYPTPDGNYAHLSKMDVAFLHSAGGAMFPDGGDIKPSYKEADMVPWVDDYLSWLDPSQRTLIRLLFILFEQSTAIFKPSFRKMSQLSQPESVEYLAGWDNSTIYLRRMAFQSLRAILCMAYCRHPQVEKEMGVFRVPNCIKNSVSQNS